MSIKISMTGLSDAIGTLPTIPANASRAVILEMSQIVFDESQRGAARHSKKGDLFASLYNRAIPGGRVVGHDEQRAPHAVFVNLGTKPHKIFPKDKKALRWVVGNRFVFAKFVNHPGYRGDGYMLNALSLALRQFSSIVDDAIKGA